MNVFPLNFAYSFLSLSFWLCQRYSQLKIHKHHRREHHVHFDHNKVVGQTIGTVLIAIHPKHSGRSDVKTLQCHIHRNEQSVCHRDSNDFVVWNTFDQCDSIHWNWFSWDNDGIDDRNHNQVRWNSLDLLNYICFHRPEYCHSDRDHGSTYQLPCVDLNRRTMRLYYLDHTFERRTKKKFRKKWNWQIFLKTPTVNSPFGTFDSWIWTNMKN